jgi:lipopolysaccharide transport system ATP-binding protein
MSDSVIQVEKLSKRFEIGERETHATLRDALTHWFAAGLRANGRRQREVLWALRDVSFDVKQGEVVGLIGRNGAGKSTLLKILARITRPTTGWAKVCGRVGSLLEVGTGFHPELTGRENVFLNGAILGMSKREIVRKFDEIVAFAEIERFIDTPVKRYSSGMYVRLAFAVAAHLDLDIVFVDEVLSVGDLNFQKKCMGKMDDVARHGRTIIFISHQMNQIRRLCQRAMWIEHGQILQSSGTHEVVSAYESAMARGAENGDRPHGQGIKARFLNWQIVEAAPYASHILSTMGPVSVAFTLKVEEPIRRGHHGCALFNHERQLIWAWATDNSLRLEPGTHTLRYAFPMLPLRPGPYSWQVSIYDEGEPLDAWDCLPDMVAALEPNQHQSDQWNGILNIPSRFEINGERNVSGQ